MLKGILSIFGIAAMAAVSPVLAGGEEQDTGFYFAVMVKSSNYAQNAQGELKLLNYHFFSEVFPKDPDTRLSGKLWREGDEASAMPYVKRKTNYYIEGGHFDSLQEVDRAYPNGLYYLSFETDRLTIDQQPLLLSGSDGRTEIPDPIQIVLFQDGVKVAPDRLDADKALTISWSKYSNGRADPNGIVDDMIFVVLQNCRGERIVHTGLPFAGPYMTYETTQIPVDQGKLKPGQSYSMFVEFPHVADSRIAEGVPLFSSYATATYLDLKTLGESADDECLSEMPPMDTGQTDR